MEDMLNEDGSASSYDSLDDCSSSTSEEFNRRTIIGSPNPSTNPIYTNNVQLYSKTEYFLKISDNLCEGSRDKEDDFTRLVMEPIPGGKLRIRGEITNQYLAMRDDNGKIYSTPDRDDENTIFYERPAGSYTTFNKIEQPNWFLAINKAGKMKMGRNTERNDASMFLKRPW